MGIYKTLSLWASGGISALKELPSANTVNIFIGLGGTGIDCIRNIKTQVYTRWKPDDIKDSVPVYNNIRFLSVDSHVQDMQSDENQWRDEGLDLEEEERFLIFSKDLSMLYQPSVLKLHPELDWLDWCNLELPLGNRYELYCSGIRQFGRFLIMEHSERFMEKIQREIMQATSDLIRAKVNIHIFSSLCGNIGSSCFLDVCYMLRDVIVCNNINASMFGYFFLPDVCLSKIPFECTDVRRYLMKNGYAAMQELDYCMQIPENGGEFEQIYKGNKKIKWDRPPVDICYLIGGVDVHGQIQEYTYENAINATANYLISRLENEVHMNFPGIIGHLNDEKKAGMNLAYCSIGVSRAVLPIKEMNTYLATKIFEKFTHCRNNVPSKADVEQVAINVLAEGKTDISEIYSAIQEKISDKIPIEYISYLDDWKYVRDYGNSELIQFYVKQKEEQIERFHFNAKKMTGNSSQSFIGRLKAELEGILEDIKRGPFFAIRILEAEENYNILNIIEGLIRENLDKWELENLQRKLRLHDYEEAKYNFETKKHRKFFDNDAARFNDYEYSLRALICHEIEIERYKILDEVLHTFYQQVKMEKSYYYRLSSVMYNLIITFKENCQWLDDFDFQWHKNHIGEIPIVTVKEIKPVLDEKIQTFDISYLMSQFMQYFIKNESAWIEENENKVGRFVNEFFLNQVFPDFSNYTIESFLRDISTKVGVNVIEVVENLIKKLTETSNVLFQLDNYNYVETQAVICSCISIPSISHSLRMAVRQLGDCWNVSTSLMVDSITAFQVMVGFPIGAYVWGKEDEKIYYDYYNPSRHIYKEWNQLPPLLPQSLINKDEAPPRLQTWLNETQKLYEQASKRKLLEENMIWSLDLKAKERFEQMIEEYNKIKSEKENFNNDLEELVQQIKSSLPLPLKKTSMMLKDDGYMGDEYIRKYVQEDYFVASLAYQKAVRETLEQIDKLEAMQEIVLEEEKLRLAEEVRKAEVEETWIQEMK